MLTLVYDTETTGLPAKGKAATLDDQPYIVQLACILYRDTTPVAHFSSYLNPWINSKGQETPGVKFFIDAGLTKAKMEPSRLESQSCMAIFNQLVRKADRTVAHNANFDAGRISDTFHRLLGDVTVEWASTPHFCTMLTLEPIMKLPAKWGKGYKWPNMDEAYRAYVDTDGFDGAHDAMNDVQATAEVLFAIERMSIPLVQI
jgi:DNA polymerase-3 subunit epsilon